MTHNQGAGAFDTVAEEIRFYVDFLWDLIKRSKTVTLSDHERTKGCLMAEILKLLLEDYEVYQLSGLSKHEIWFAHATVYAFKDICK